MFIRSRSQTTAPRPAPLQRFELDPLAEPGEQLVGPRARRRQRISSKVLCLTAERFGQPSPQNIPGRDYPAFALLQQFVWRQFDMGKGPTPHVVKGIPVAAVEADHWQAVLARGG